VVQLRRATRDDLRGMVWAARAVRSVRRQLRRTGYVGVVVPPLPPRPDETARGVRFVLRRLSTTCLERAMIEQRWQAAQGNPRDVLVGVRGPGAAFRAHAWLEGDEPPGEESGYRELLRIQP
jgi:hypothetical protein